MNKRTQNKSSIASGEGKADKIFLTHLKKLYGSRQAKHSIDIPSNNTDGHTGGSSVDVVKEIMQRCSSRNYDALLVLLDGDILQHDCTTLIQKAKSKCRKDIRHKIPNMYKCIVIHPCLEGLLLNIKGITCSETYSCKRQFKKEFGKEAHQLTERELNTAFQRQLLDKQRSRIPELDMLIRYFEINTWEDFSEYFCKPEPKKK